MKKIRHIAFREFKTRIRKKAFLISTIMGPIFMLALLIVPYYFSSETSTNTKVALANFPFDIPSVEDVQIDRITTQLPDTLTNQYNTVLSYIQAPHQNEPIIHFYTTKNIPLVESYLTTTIKEQLYNIPNLLIKKVQITPKTATNNANLFYSYGAPILIYFFIFLYGIQIMKGITEEKSNRIMEVLLCTVKPFEMMVGKILGIFSMALVQFGIWAASSTLIYNAFYHYYHLERFQSALTSTSVPGISDDFGASLHLLVTTLSPTNVMAMGGVFLIYFVGGYFLFGALFAIVGAASDPETDTQQFLFPITVPLLLSFMLLDVVIGQPTGRLASFLSLFPFTSPIIMPACFGSGQVQWWQLCLSIFLLVGGFLITTWVASRIYRVGVLAAGAKVSYGTLVKWFLEKK